MSYRKPEDREAGDLALEWYEADRQIADSEFLTGDIGGPDSIERDPLEYEWYSDELLAKLDAAYRAYKDVWAELDARTASFHALTEAELEALAEAS
jgi:hypothetical protein